MSEGRFPVRSREAGWPARVRRDCGGRVAVRTAATPAAGPYSHRNASMALIRVARRAGR